MRISDWSSDVCSSDLKPSTPSPSGGRGSRIDRAAGGTSRSWAISTRQFYCFAQRRKEREDVALGRKATFSASFPQTIAGRIKPLRGLRGPFAFFAALREILFWNLPGQPPKATR